MYNIKYSNLHVSPKQMDLRFERILLLLLGPIIVIIIQQIYCIP